MKYNLNLTREYCAHWNVKEALRELIANTIDEEGTIEFNDEYTYVEGTENEELITSPSCLKLINEDTLPLEAFLMGYSAKSADKPTIGQYGEGMKLAFLVLTRLDMPFTFLSGEHQYEFGFEIPTGFGVETLHVCQTNLTPERSVVGTEITLFDISKTDLRAVYIDAPLNTAFPGQGLYCHGLLVEKDFYVSFEMGVMNPKKYGINLDYIVKGNRDRNYFTDKKLIGPLLEKQFTPKDFVSLSTSWYTGDLLQSLSSEFKQKIAKEWLISKSSYYTSEMLENKTVLMPTSVDARYRKQANVLVAPYWWYGSYITTRIERDLLDALYIDADEFNTEVDESNIKRKKTNRLLREASECVTVDEVALTISRYVVVINNHRHHFERELINIMNGITVNKSVEVNYLEIDEDDDDEE